MLEYMEKKYGETFTEPEPYGGQHGKEYSMIKVKGGKVKSDGILVRKVWKDGRCFYQDNYLAYLLRGQIERHIKDLAEPVFGECRVFYKIPEMVFPEDTSADMKMEEFLKSSWAMVRIYLYVKDSSFNEKERMEEFCLLLQGKKYLAGGVVSWPLNKEHDQKINEENFMRAAYMGYQYEAEVIFSIRDKNASARLKWKE